MSGQKFELAVVGSGIAGLTAALVAARMGRKAVVLTGDVLGGQLLSIEKVDGYPGFPEGVPGYDLCPIAQEQAANAGAEFVTTEVEGLEAAGDAWRLATGEGAFEARAVVLATGCSLKELGVPGEETLRGKGVSHCATCDAPLLRNKPAAVVGGGDSGLQEALTLVEHASHVFILERGDALTAQAVYQDLIKSNSKVEIRCNTIVEEVLGTDKVSGIRVRDVANDATSELEAAGIFAYVGLKPNAALVQDHLVLDPSGAVLTDAWMRTRMTGVFAVGTVRSGSPARAVSCAGDGATAAIAVDHYLRDGNWAGNTYDDAAKQAAGGR